MKIPKDPIMPLEDEIKEFVNNRIHSCSYYHSPEYHENRKKALKLDHKIRKCLGKKKWKEIWNYSFDIDSLDGEMYGRVAESCYRLGFADAVVMSRELNQVGKGHQTIFN